MQNLQEELAKAKLARQKKLEAKAATESGLTPAVSVAAPPVAPRAPVPSVAAAPPPKPPKVASPRPAVAAPTESSSSGSGGEKFAKYTTMQKLNLPEGAIRQKMTTDGFSAADQDLFFKSNGAGGSSESAAPAVPYVRATPPAPKVVPPAPKVVPPAPKVVPPAPKVAIAAPVPPPVAKVVAAPVVAKPIAPTYAAPSSSAGAAKATPESDEKYAKFIKMQKLNLPEGAIRQKMTTDAFSAVDQDLFFKIYGGGDSASAEPATPHVPYVRATPPPAPKPQVKTTAPVPPTPKPTVVVVAPNPPIPVAPVKAPSPTAVSPRPTPTPPAAAPAPKDKLQKYRDLKGMGLKDDAIKLIMEKDGCSQSEMDGFLNCSGTSNTVGGILGTGSGSGHSNSNSSSSFSVSAAPAASSAPPSTPSFVLSPPNAATESDINASVTPPSSSIAVKEKISIDTLSQAEKMQKFLEMKKLTDSVIRHNMINAGIAEDEIDAFFNNTPTKSKISHEVYETSLRESFTSPFSPASTGNTANKPPLSSASPSTSSKSNKGADMSDELLKQYSHNREKKEISANNTDRQSMSLLRVSRDSLVSSPSGVTSRSNSGSSLSPNRASAADISMSEKQRLMTSGATTNNRSPLKPAVANGGSVTPGSAASRVSNSNSLRSSPDGKPPMAPTKDNCTKFTAKSKVELEIEEMERQQKLASLTQKEQQKLIEEEKEMLDHDGKKTDHFLALGNPYFKASSMRISRSSNEAGLAKSREMRAEMSYKDQQALAHARVHSGSTNSSNNSST